MTESQTQRRLIYRAAVSGASGFVGLHLLRALVANAEQIAAIHNRPLSPNIAQRYGPSVSWFRADIVNDDLSQALQGVEVMFHLAAHASVSEAADDVLQMERINILGTARLAAASKRAGVRHFIFVSSIAACEVGVTADIDESSGVPRGSYGRTKRAAEDSLLALSSPDFAVTVLRPTSLFGEDHLGSVYELVRVVKSGLFYIFGDGSNRTNFYYVGDFISILLAVAGNAKAFGKIFIAADRPHSLQEIVTVIERALGSKHRVRHLPRALGLAAGIVCDLVAALSGRSMPLSRRRVRAMMRDVAYHNGKLANVLGLGPDVGVLEGLRRSIVWYRQAGLL